MFENFFVDVRYAVRFLVKRPAYTLTIIGILAVTIGASTAVFSVVYGVILRPIPYDEPEQLVAFSNAVFVGRSDVLNTDAIDELREVNRSFESVALIATLTPLMERSADQYLVRVPADFFPDLLRVDPVLGRHFTPDDDRPGAEPVAIISHAYWQTRLGGAPEVVGQTIRHPEYPQLVVVGVLPPDFRSPEDLEAPPHFWVPLGSGPRVPPTRMYPAIGRLRPGVTIEEAEAELEAIKPGVIGAGGDRMAGHDLAIKPLADRYGSATERGTIILFFGAVLAVLLVGIANLAGLELARLPQFEGELAVRSTLGATRWRLARLMLTRTLLVGLAGGVVGTLVAAGATRALGGTLPNVIPRRLDIGVDRNVWLFAIGVSLLSSVLIALVPAIRASGAKLRDALSIATRSATIDRRYRLFQDGLTGLQIGMTLVLVVGGGIAMHSFWRMATVDWGFDPERVAVINVRLPTDYPTPRFESVFEEIRTALGPMTEGNAVAFTDTLSGFRSTSRFFRASDASPIPPNVETGGSQRDALVAAGFRRFDFNAVSSEFFDVLDVPVLEGRGFTPAEARDAAPVTIVSESVARMYWPGRSPIGQRLEYTATEGDPIGLTVIGVVGDVRGAIRDQELDQTVYLPSGHIFRTQQGPSMLGELLVARTTAPPQRIEEAIIGIDPSARVQVNWMTDRFAVQIDRDKFFGILLGCFSGIALLLAAVGVYSVVSYAVDRRVRELGVRMALGAQRSRLFFEVLRRVLVTAAFGVALGLAGSIAFSRVLGTYLYSIEPEDSMAYVIVLPILLAAILTAGVLPAIRASRLDPLEALRYE